MFMKKTNKKRGFTITELVVVIAVIAILSAVLIPTFSGIIKKSKESADQQAVRNMNTVLTEVAIDEDANIYDVYAALGENNIDAENYKPLIKDRFFFYYGAEKQIIYTDGNYKVLYPKHLAGASTAQDRETWVSLSGSIKEAKIENVDISNGTATVDSAEELVAVFNAIEKKTKTVSTIELNNDVNLMGAKLQLEKKADFTFDGNNKTLSGIANLDAVRENASNTSGTGRKYFAGLVGNATGNVTFKDINIENATFGSDSASMVGIFVGHASGKNTTVTIENVTVNNVTVRGMMKVGAFVGQLSSGAKLEIKGENTITNVSVEAVVGFAGKFVGLAHAASATDPIIANAVNAATYASNISVELVKNASVQYVTVDGVEYATDMDALDWTFGTNDNGKKEYCRTITQGYCFTSLAYANDDAQETFQDGVLKYKDMAELKTL